MARSRRSWVATVLALTLLVSGATVDGGRVDIQPMPSFGPQWSGNAQLLWSGAGVGSALELTVDVVEAGAYAVVPRMTQAPDYADARFELDDQASFISFVGVDRITSTMLTRSQ